MNRVANFNATREGIGEYKCYTPMTYTQHPDLPRVGELSVKHTCAREK